MHCQQLAADNVDTTTATTTATTTMQEKREKWLQCCQHDIAIALVVVVARSAVAVDINPYFVQQISQLATTRQQ